MQEWVTEINHKEFKYKGLRCEIIRNKHLGNLCGYVGVGINSLAYGLERDNIFIRDIDVHGGITFTEKSNTESIWWIGFDCSHSGDITPLITSIHVGTYKNIAYVEKECRKLADQLIEMDRQC